MTPDDPDHDPSESPPAASAALVALVPIAPAFATTSITPATTAAERLVKAFLAGRTKTTLRAYAGDLETFRGFTGAITTADAAALLLGQGHGEANALTLAYRAQLREREPALSTATINRRLAALRSLVHLARTIGMMSWQIDVENLPHEVYRDTKGPAHADVERLLAEAATNGDAIGTRDYAMLRLLRDLALRRGEVVSLDVEHVDLGEGTVAILGKGRAARETRTLPAPTIAALKAWLEVRGAEPGPLFMNLDVAHFRGRLSATSLYRRVSELGRRLGVRVRPHGLRHASITRALDLTGGDVRAVQKFSRHRDPRTLLIYDDNRRDLAGDVARLVAAGDEGGPPEAASGPGKPT